MKLRENESKLRRLYLSLVDKAVRENGRPSRLKDTKAGYENHHIQSQNMGGNDHPLNLVRFTYRQHYIAHLLLSSLMGTKFNLKASTSRKYATKQATVNESRKATLDAKYAGIEKAVRELVGADKARSEANKGKVFTCPHCGKSGGGGMTRWHFDNCKLK